jgi:hypothetical protein
LLESFWNTALEDKRLFEMADFGTLGRVKRNKKAFSSKFQLFFYKNRNLD